MGLIQKAFGDIITFSRSSNATRIGPTGRVEYAPHNLLTYSEQFDNAAWILARASVVANAVTAPNGTVTADKLVEDTTASNNHRVRQDISTSAIPYTFTVFCKAAERGYVALYNLTTLSGQVFDLITGTVGVAVGTAPTSASITSAGNGWYRCSITVTATAATNSWSLYILPSNTSTLTYTGDGTSGIYLWGAQLSVGSVPGDYTPTTSAAVYGPRFDFNPVTLAARGLLIEEQRTNLLTYSEQFDNASWVKADMTVTANSTIAPDGTATADTIVSSSFAYTSVYQTITVTSGQSYTLSMYAKANVTSRLSLEFRGSGSSPDAIFDLSNGSVVSGSGSISAVGNGWYRCSITKTSVDTSEIAIISINGASTSTGNSIYIWGAQLEAGSFATSYIPTVASTVTRSADVASVDTVSPWYSGTESTLFAEFDIIGAGSPQTIASLQASAVADGLLLYKSGTGLNMLAIVDASSATLGTLSLNTAAKVALAYNGSANGAALNGGSVSSVGTTVSATATKLSIGASFNGTANKLNGHIRRIAYYPRRLTNAQLQALTA